MSSAYGAVVLEHFRRPRNRGSLADATASHEAYNALCGDRVRIDLRASESIIEAAAFTANACAICTAGASLLTEGVKGLSVAEAGALTEDHCLDALGAPIPPARVACATLALQALHKALEKVPLDGSTSRL